jgi:hypothetical protein
MILDLKDIAMKRFFTTAIAALALGGTALAAVPAEARPGGWGGGHSFHGGGHGWNGHGGYRGGGGYRGYRGGYGRGYYGYGYGPGVAIGAGVLGLAVGSALASDRYNDGYYGAPEGYYHSPYAYPGYGY